jgi:hypothetical protein
LRICPGTDGRDHLQGSAIKVPANQAGIFFRESAPGELATALAAIETSFPIFALFVAKESQTCRLCNCLHS